MQPATETNFDASSALIVGRREHQEDAVIADFPIGSDTGVIVLSDGMGGHAAGDVASKIVMTEVFCELKFQSGDPEILTGNIQDILRDALHGANDCLAAHIKGNPRVRGMGATLLAAVFQGAHLTWISVGDSPLYLYRDGMLRQLNEDHSMAPQIDQMAACGMMDRDVAREHPDRNALISVLAGSEVAKIDCPETPFELRDGDLVIAASDGLQSLEDNRIASLLRTMSDVPSAEIARGLLKAIAELDDPEQDNTSIAVVQVQQANAPDVFADAVRSAVSFAEAFGTDHVAPVMAEPDEALEMSDKDDRAQTGPADPDLAAAIAAVTSSFQDEEEPAEAEATDRSEAMEDALDPMDQEEKFGSDLPVEPVMGDEALPEHTDTADSRSSDEEDDPSDGETIVAVEQEEESGGDIAPTDVPVVVVPELKRAELHDASDLDPDAEVDDASENIFGLDATDDADEEDATDPSAAVEEPSIPLFDDEIDEEDGAEADPGDAAMVSLRAEPRNERRPGAPILRRIVVEASR
ncbi:MAG: protein phosphatase 2C domain-containing protein [Pseudomonadota bacterium]